ncbi:MAG: hypothetical protein WB662_03440, partial [Methyloceanibacter sp.]
MLDARRTLTGGERRSKKSSTAAPRERDIGLEHIQAFPIPGGIPKSRKQCESSVAWGDGGR